VCCAHACCRDGSKILTSSDDGSARLWSVESGQQLHEFKGHSKKLCSASFSSDDSKLLTCSEVTPVHPRATRVWCCDSGRLLLDTHATAAESTSRHLSQRPSGCESVFSPDGLHVVRQPYFPSHVVCVSEIMIIPIQVTVSDDRLRMRLSLASTGEAALQLGPFSAALHSFQFSEDALLLLLCCVDRSCHVFCGRSAVLFLSIPPPPTAPPLLPAHASFSPDCRQVVLLSAGSSSVHLHSLHTSCLQTPYTINEM
jgi:hypothetical protein